MNRLRAQRDYKSGDSRTGLDEGRRVEELQKEVNYLKAEIRANQSGGQADSLRKEIERLSRENNEVKETRQDLQEEKRLLSNQISELKGHIGKLESEVNISRTKEGQLAKTLA